MLTPSYLESGTYWTSSQSEKHVLSVPILSDVKTHTTFWHKVTLSSNTEFDKEHSSYSHNKI